MPETRNIPGRESTVIFTIGPFHDALFESVHAHKSAVSIIRIINIFAPLVKLFTYLIYKETIPVIEYTALRQKYSNDPYYMPFGRYNHVLQTYFHRTRQHPLLLQNQ